VPGVTVHAAAWLGLGLAIAESVMSQTGRLELLSPAPGH
jgi:hypothetical protein